MSQTCDAQLRSARRLVPAIIRCTWVRPGGRAEVVLLRVVVGGDFIGCIDDHLTPHDRNNA